MIANRKNYRLYAPKNCWDTNYHLLDDDKKIEYLIDIHDITNDENDDEYLFFGTLIELKDIEYILMFAWKKLKY